MTTAADIISEASAQLHGWGITQDRVAVLSEDIDAITSTLKVEATFGQSVGISPGVIEIGSEQLYVTGVDAATGICTLANGFGRGFSGTAAVNHDAGSKIVSRPRFPRVWLLKVLNEVVGSLYPKLFVPKTFTTTVTYPADGYALPSRPEHILDVQYQDVIGRWQPLPSYNFDAFDGTLRVRTGVVPGRPLRVVYAVRPTPFTSETDDFTITGLPASAVDVLSLGVVAKVVPGLDISRAQSSSVEQSARSSVVPPNAGLTASKYLMQLYMDRLENEAAALRMQYKPRMRRVV